MATVSKIYANAVAKYDEGKLLDEEQLRRIAEADYPDAVRMLYDHGYGEGVPVEEADPERLLRLETEKLIESVKEYAPGEPLKLFLLARYAFVNAKAAYKSKFAAVGDAAFYGGLGEIRDIIERGEYDALPYPELAEALTALDAAAENAPPKSKDIDAALTKAEYAAEARLAKKLGRRIREYARRRADFTNMLAAYRVRRFGGKGDDFLSMAVSGGAVPPEAFLPVAEGEAETFLSELDCEYLTGPAGELLSANDVAAYEREAEESCASVMIRNAEDMLSFDPFIVYVTGKIAEIAAIRLVLMCVKNGAKDEIKRRLRRRDD